MEQKFAPSLMAMDLMNVQKQIEGLNPYAYYYHVDVIDWHYARNMCLSPEFIGQLRRITTTPLDVHLMVKDLGMEIIEAVADAGADIISLPQEEIGKNAFKYISYIKGRGKKFGVVLDPATPCLLYTSRPAGGRKRRKGDGDARHALSILLKNVTHIRRNIWNITKNVHIRREIYVQFS